MATSRRASTPVLDIEPLMTASRTINAVIVRSVAAVDDSLTVPKLRVLVILDRRGSANIAEVATDLGVNPSNASRTCDQLVQQGLVLRTVDQADRRRVVLTLADAGRTLLEEVMDHRRGLLATAVARMSPDQQRRLMRALEAFNAATVALEDMSLEGVNPRSLATL